MVEETKKPDGKQPKETTEKPVAQSAPAQASSYKLTEPGKDFRMTKGGWPPTKKKA